MNCRPKLPWVHCTACGLYIDVPDVWRIGFGIEDDGTPTYNVKRSAELALKVHSTACAGLLGVVRNALKVKGLKGAGRVGIGKLVKPSK